MAGPRQERNDITQLSGIVSVVQTPFDERNRVDRPDLERLVEHAIQSGVDGLLAPVVASEAAWLSDEERLGVLETIARVNSGRVAFILGASSGEIETCRNFARLAMRIGADAWLVAVPAELYRQPGKVAPFFRAAAEGIDLPLVIQDLEFNGPGLPLEAIQRLADALPTLAGLKVETAPAGPKYTAVRELFGDRFFIAGGWAVPQMIEALDRGVDAMIPESSMIPVYSAIDRAHRSGNRARARELFNRLVPVLAFTNQELVTSIAFFKRLLVRKSVFATANLRAPGFTWDAYNRRIADELIEEYLRLEAEVTE